MRGSSFWYIAGAVLVGALVGALAASRLPHRYQATVVLLATLPPELRELDVVVTATELRELLRSDNFAINAAHHLGLDPIRALEMERTIRLDEVGQTRMIRLTVISRLREQAAVFANVIADDLVASHADTMKALADRAADLARKAGAKLKERQRALMALLPDAPASEPGMMSGIRNVIEIAVAQRDGERGKLARIRALLSSEPPLLTEDHDGVIRVVSNLVHERLDRERKSIEEQLTHLDQTLERLVGPGARANDYELRNVEYASLLGAYGTLFKRAALAQMVVDGPGRALRIEQRAETPVTALPTATARWILLGGLTGGLTGWLMLLAAAQIGSHRGRAALEAANKKLES